MDQSLDNRRLDARFSEASIRGVRATLRPGCLVSVIDLSAGGALVEAPRPLRPGARVHLQVVTGQRSFALAAHVVRCAVWAVDPHGVRYRGALRFEHPCDWFGDSMTPGESPTPC